MKVLGNVDILGFASGAFKEYADFPQDPKVGTWAVIHGSVMTCMEVAEAPVWLPLTEARNTHIHTQDTPNATWMVEHKLGSENVLIQCFDSSNNVIVPSSIRTVDEDVTEVVMPDIFVGKAIVMYGLETGVSATGKISGGGGGLGIGHLADFPNRECITDGYIPLDGQRIHRSVYPEFVDIFGKDLDYVDLPDANGTRLFFRGGADETNPFGQIENDAIVNITGSLGKVQLRDASVNVEEGALFAKETHATSYGGSGSFCSVELGFDASRVVDTADETRPVNTSVIKCIKAFGGKVNEGGVDIPSLLERVNQLELSMGFSAIENGWDYAEQLDFPIGFPLIVWAGSVSKWSAGDLTRVYITSHNRYVYGCDKYGAHNSGKWLAGEWALTGYVGATAGVETAIAVRVK